MSRRLVDGQMPRRPGPNAKKPGRKSQLVLDQTLVDKICQPLLIGMPITSSAALHSISFETMRQWVIKGKEDPTSIYGVLIAKIQKNIAEWEGRDLSIIDMHVQGRPAEYEMEVVRDKKGEIVYQTVVGRDGQERREPVKQAMKDGDGNPVLKRAAIKSDWRAAMTRLSRRKPKTWERHIRIDIDHDTILTFDNKKPETKESLTFEQRIGQLMDQLEEDV